MKLIDAVCRWGWTKTRCTSLAFSVSSQPNSYQWYISRRLKVGSPTAWTTLIPSAEAGSRTFVGRSSCINDWLCSKLQRQLGQCYGLAYLGCSLWTPGPWKWWKFCCAGVLCWNLEPKGLGPRQSLARPASKLAPPWETSRARRWSLLFGFRKTATGRKSCASLHTQWSCQRMTFLGALTCTLWVACL